MVSTKNHLRKTENEQFVQPAERFVTDFTGLVTAVDRLMVDIGGVIRTEHHKVKPNSHARPLTLNGTISTLQNHALPFVKSIRRFDLLSERKGVNGIAGNGSPPLLNELAVNLCRAQTLKSIADTVASYCGKAFHSPAGMVFVEQDGGLELVSQWHPNEVPKKNLLEEIRNKGPVFRAFRTGELVLWRRERHSNIGRYLSRFLQRCQGQSVTFLPISVPEQRPIGVLAIVLAPAAEFAPAPYEALIQLAEIVTVSISRARAYDEAVAARTRAERALQSKDEFLSILSHELKNPMMPILGWAVALSSGTLPADKQNLAVERIIRSVRSLNYLVEDLFDTMRISSGKFSLEFAETRIQEVAHEALTAIQHVAESKKLRISTDIAEGIPPFMADFRRLQQVLMNLLNNSVKFTPEGGSIALRIQTRDGLVECIVSDTGKGIEHKFLPFVFERFQQEKRTSKVHAAGLGLGLSIVREIVDLHGGSIAAFSEGTDKGTTFIVRLPMRRGPARNESRTPPAER